MDEANELVEMRLVIPMAAPEGQRGDVVRVTLEQAGAMLAQGWAERLDDQAAA